MVWQLFYFLNVGFPTQFPANSIEDFENEFNSVNFWERFNDSITDSSDEDLYYLLQAFFEIANERTKNKDWDLIKLICSHIFHVSLFCLKVEKGSRQKIPLPIIDGKVIQLSGKANIWESF